MMLTQTTRRQFIRGTTVAAMASALPTSSLAFTANMDTGIPIYCDPTIGYLESNGSYFKFDWYGSDLCPFNYKKPLAYFWPDKEIFEIVQKVSGSHLAEAYHYTTKVDERVKYGLPYPIIPTGRVLEFGGNTRIGPTYHPYPNLEVRGLELLSHTFILLPDGSKWANLIDNYIDPINIRSRWWIIEYLDGSQQEIKIPHPRKHYQQPMICIDKVVDIKLCTSRVCSEHINNKGNFERETAIHTSRMSDQPDFKCYSNGVIDHNYGPIGYGPIELVS